MLTKEEYISLREELAWLFTSEEMETLEHAVPTIANLFREARRDRNAKLWGQTWENEGNEIVLMPKESKQ